VLDRMNASGAGVTASLDDTAQRVTIVSDDPSQELVLDSGETGFFSALEISDGTYHPTQGSGGGGKACPKGTPIRLLTRSKMWLRP
jgi:hypothetical protein